VRQGKDIRWYENELVSAVVKELIREEKTEWFESVKFTGNSIIVEGVYNEGKSSKRGDDDVRKALAEDIQRRTSNLFSGSVSVTANCSIYRLGGFEVVDIILARNLKEEFINQSPNAFEFKGRRLGDKINYESVWKTVLGSGKPEPGLEIDLKSEKRNENTRSVSTINVVDEFDGFVTKYLTTVTMHESRNGSAESVDLEVLVHGSRRRASAKQWKEFKIGESLYASGPAGHLRAYQTSVPLLEAITTRLKK
jgi:hypothetical protein